MKKLILLFVYSLICMVAVYAQPQAFKYSAVAVSPGGQPVTDPVAVRFTIRENSANGAVRYEEIHNTTPNGNGKFNLDVGRGNATFGQFSALNWGANQYWLQVELSISGGSFNQYGVDQLLSVPYALYAAASGGNPADNDADPTNELQQLAATDSTLSLIPNGGQVKLPAGPKGEKGDKGDPGVAGPAGPEGPAGPKGDKGDPGVAGPAGPEGPAGPKGDKGDPGVAGPVGPEGPVGPKGDKGDPGVAGPAGPEGPAGPKGDKGDPGVAGPAGPEGPAGPKGDKGDPGVAGPAGPEGPAGPKGDKGDPGVAGPAGPEGPAGPKGDKGDPGIAGPAGPEGPAGPKGDKGDPGVAGPAGPEGPAGPKGDKGDPGIAGPVGPEGPAGPKGDKGDPGVAGPAGPQGPPGVANLEQGMGIILMNNNDTTLVMADNEAQIWNAGKLRGRPIDGMAPNPGFIMAYKDNTSGWVSYENDLEINNNTGKVEVAALRGRPIDGMPPNPGFIMAYKDNTSGWVSYDNDLEINNNTGKVEVAALRGRPIDGMPPNPGFIMAYKNNADGWVSYPNDLAITNNRLEVAKLKGLDIDLTGAVDGMALTCKDNGSGGLEFRCLPAASIPLTFNGSSSSPLISITNSNTSNTASVAVTNGGRYAINGTTSKGDPLPIPISTYFSRTFNYPAGVQGKNTNAAQEGSGIYGTSVSPLSPPTSNQVGVGVGGFFQGGWIGAVGIGYEDAIGGVVGLKKANANGNKENQWAVYGESDNFNRAYAGYFKGDVRVTRNLVVDNVVKSGGSFRIDHPQYPEEKYLYHSFVESPDMKNVYDGVVTTDDQGYATVELPGYFEALNKDFRYQLTCIGEFAQAIVSKKVQNNTFEIRTDKPGVEVSWQITGIRKDPYAEANRIQVEVDKTGMEKGKYLHPELYQQPDNRKIGTDEFRQPDNQK